MPDDAEDRRYALTLNPREPECMPLGLMSEIWKAVGWAAKDAGYRAFLREETGAGVVWFEKDDPSRWLCEDEGHRWTKAMKGARVGRSCSVCGEWAE